MSKHHGQTLERAIRKAGINLTDLARELNVDRRTIYNWFQSPKLKESIICRIGRIIRYDFFVDFPELLETSQCRFDGQNGILNNIDNEKTWKDKYDLLLKDYNKLLL